MSQKPHIRHSKYGKPFKAGRDRFYVAGDNEGLLAHLERGFALTKARGLSKLGFRTKVKKAKAGGYNVMIAAV